MQKQTNEQTNKKKTAVYDVHHFSLENLNSEGKKYVS